MEHILTECHETKTKAISWKEEREEGIGKKMSQGLMRAQN